MTNNFHAFFYFYGEMISEKSVSFYTLGCKLNFAESASISRSIHQAGFQIVEEGAESDICVINTCSVTEQADKKCRKLVKEVLAQNPNTRIAIIGCYAQLKPEALSAIQGVDLILGAKEKFLLANYLPELEKIGKAKVYHSPIEQVIAYTSSWSSTERTRSFLKIQDGCNYTCSFCTIPQARGISRNDSIENIVLKANEIAVEGIQEIVLTGVNIGDFGHSTGENFLRLIKQLDQVKGIKRFRISSIEPNLLTEEIIIFVARSAKFVPHFHIPLQSGSNNILALMRRRYRAELYASRINFIKKYLPECCIGVDIITGFPGETNDEFLETYTFLSELAVSYLHVFSYSERANTFAISLQGKVTEAEKSRRSKMLHALSEKKKHHFYEQFIGSEMDVILETDHKNGLMHGFTPNYIKVSLPYNRELMKKTVRVKLIHHDDYGAIRGDLLYIYPTEINSNIIQN